jgi:hypothetical protein
MWLVPVAAGLLSFPVATFIDQAGDVVIFSTAAARFVCLALLAAIVLRQRPGASTLQKSLLALAVVLYVGPEMAAPIFPEPWNWVMALLGWVIALILTGYLYNNMNSNAHVAAALPVVPKTTAKPVQNAPVSRPASSINNKVTEAIIKQLRYNSAKKTIHLQDDSTYVRLQSRPSSADDALEKLWVERVDYPISKTGIEGLKEALKKSYSSTTSNKEYTKDLDAISVDKNASDKFADYLKRFVITYTDTTILLVNNKNISIFNGKKNTEMPCIVLWQDEGKDIFRPTVVKKLKITETTPNDEVFKHLNYNKEKRTIRPDYTEETIYYMKPAPDPSYVLEKIAGMPNNLMREEGAKTIAELAELLKTFVSGDETTNKAIGNFDSDVKNDKDISSLFTRFANHTKLALLCIHVTMIDLINAQMHVEKECVILYHPSNDAPFRIANNLKVNKASVKKPT